MTLFAELKRRNVIRVAAFYALSSWLVLQVADVLFGLLTVPDWTLKFVLGLLILGFPFALVFSWVYEMTPEGVKREKDIDRSQSITPETGRKLNTAIIAALALGGGLLVWNQLLRAPNPVSAIVAEPEAAIEPVGSDEFAVPAPAGPSVAVLPFVNMSSDTEQEFFSDGLSDTLIHVLAQVEGIKVAARTSSFAYKGKNTDVREIGRELGVNTLLEGSVQKAGSQLRIIAQLVDARDGSHLWSKTFDRSDEDIFSIQDEISREVVVALKGSLLSADEAEIAGRYQPSLEAYNAFIKGREKMALRSSQGLQSAEARFRSALALDPNYALAMVNLGDVLALQVEHGDLIFEEIKDEVQRLYEQALALDPQLGEVYASLARMADDRGEQEEAAALFRKAIEINPNYPTSYHWYALRLHAAGKLEEAVAMMQRAFELDPLSDIININLAGYALDEGRVADAKRRVLKGLARNPAFKNYYGVLAQIAGAEGDIVSAVRRLAVIVESDVSRVNVRAWLCSMLGNFPDWTEATACFQSLVKEYPGHPASIPGLMLMDIHAGRYEAALKHTEGQSATTTAGRNNSAWYISAAVLARLGRFDEARVQLAKLAPRLFLPGGPDVNPVNYFDAIILAYIELQSGNAARGELLLTRVMTLIEGADRRFGLGIGIADAYVYAMRGENDQALAAMADAVAQGWRQDWWWAMNVSPALDPIRQEPEFHRLFAVVEADMTAQQVRWRENPAPLPIL